MKITITIKVAGAFFLIALLCAGMALLSITGVQKIQAELESLITRDLQQMTLVERVLTEMLNMETGVRGFVASSNEFFSDESYLSPYTHGKEAIAQALDNLEGLMQTEEERSILKELRSTVKSFEAYSQKVIALVRLGDVVSARNQIADGKAITDGFRQIYDRFLLLNQERLAQRQSSARMAARRLAVVLSAAGLSAVVAVIFIFFLVSRNIASPLHRLQRILATMARSEGDLTQQIQIKTGDELEELAEATNSLIGGIRRLILEIRAMASDVLTAGASLSEVAHQVQRSIQQIAETVEQMAQGSQQQAKSAESASMASTDLAAIIDQVSQGAAAAVGSASQAQQATVTGREVLQKASSQMDSIHASSEAVEELIKALGSRSGEIQHIVETITAIADQTNLLALNAAIEAARAGEQGRGFAVVAEEVRKLAEQSRQAAEQIAALISEIQSSTQKAVAAMASNSREVQNGIQAVQATAETFTLVAAAIQEITGQVEEVAHLAGEMAQKSHQVVTHIESIAATTEEHAASTQEVAAAAAEQFHAIEQITAAVDDLKMESQRLKEMIERFKA